MSIEPFPHRIWSACCSIRGHLRRSLLWYIAIWLSVLPQEHRCWNTPCWQHTSLPSQATIVAPPFPLSCIIFQINALQFIVGRSPKRREAIKNAKPLFCFLATPSTANTTVCILPVAFSWTGPYLHHHDQSPSAKPRAFPKLSLFHSGALLSSSQSWLFVLDVMPSSWLDSEVRPLLASDALHPSFRNDATCIPNHAHQIKLPRFIGKAVRITCASELLTLRLMTYDSARTLQSTEAWSHITLHLTLCTLQSKFSFLLLLKYRDTLTWKA